MDDEKRNIKEFVKKFLNGAPILSFLWYGIGFQIFTSTVFISFDLRKNTKWALMITGASFIIAGTILFQMVLLDISILSGVRDTIQLLMIGIVGLATLRYVWKIDKDPQKRYAKMNSKSTKTVSYSTGFVG